MVKTLNMFECGRKEENKVKLSGGFSGGSEFIGAWTEFVRSSSFVG